MKIKCRHRGCRETFEDDATHEAFTRIAAKRAGWGYALQVHRTEPVTRGLDFCPSHKTAHPCKPSPQPSATTAHEPGDRRRG